MVSDIVVKKDEAILRINPLVYPLDIVYSAAYVFLDSAYILLDGNPKKEIIVKMKPKHKDGKAEKLGREFLNELINYADYSKRAEETKAIRKIILQRALITNDESLLGRGLDFETEDPDEHIDDPEGIAVPWEEKYGKKREKKKRKDGKVNTK